MPFTRSTLLRIIKTGSAILVICIIVAYALWRSFTYVQGPSISITEPQNGDTITASTTIIRGIVERANSITLNGKSISIDEQGNFIETIIIFPGVNVISFEARDQFERSVETKVRVYKPQE
jgi:hypothetical protein